jgi:hypothetical protein
MYCPQCGIEYREGVTECSGCHVPLLTETNSQNPQAAPDPPTDLVTVLESNDAIQLAMAKGLLEDSGIPFFTRGEIATLVQEIDPLLRKWIRVYVPRDRENEARELLAQLHQPVPGEAT